jgi:hypothetical protein
VVGKDPERRHDESALERADGQHSGRRAAAVFQQLFQPLHLTFIVAEDERGRRAVEQRAQSVEIAVYPLRREETDLKINRLLAQEQPRESFDPLAPAGGLLEDRVAAGHFLSQLARDLEVVLGLAPGAADLVGIGAACLGNQNGLGREQLEQGAAEGGSRSCGSPVANPVPGPGRILPHARRRDRQDRHLLQFFQRALAGEVEAAERRDVVAPPLAARRGRHPEAVYIHDTAPHAELRHFGDGGDPAVSHSLERGDDVPEWLAGSNLQ